MVALVASLVVISMMVHASPAHGQESGSSLPTVKGHISILEDASGTLSLPDILDPATQAHFRSVAGQDLNFGYTHHPVWVRLEIPATGAGNGILTFTPNFLDLLDIYVAPPGRGRDASDYVLYGTGDHRSPPLDGISSLDNAVRVQFEQGDTTRVLIRILNTNSSSHLSIRLATEEDHARTELATTTAFGVWFGGMGVLFVTQLVFFYFARRTQYLLLAFSTLGIILIYAGNLGYSHVWLFPNNGPANDMFIGVNAWGGLAASALAYASILDLKRRSPLLYRLYLVTAAVGIVGVGFAIAGRNTLFGPFGSSFSIVMAVVNMVQGLRYANAEGTASRLTAAAFAFVCIGAFLSMVQRLGVDWLPNLAAHSYGIAGLVQTTLLTGALAVRLRDAEALNLRMKDDALKSARETGQLAARIVEERTAELVEARRVAEDALQAEMQSQLRQVRFLEVVSHQYRTPLAAIRSSIDSIELSLPPENAGDRSRIERVRRSIARLVEILEVNLARSRIQGPSFRLEPVRVTVGSVVRSTLQRAGDLVNGPEIELDMPDDAAAGVVLADPAMLELALLNVLENAVKYTALKGTAPILVVVRREDASILLTVQDEGIGIPTAEAAHVFEDSVRGSNVRSVEGSGLGLFLVAKIMAAHEGNVEIDSREGVGTTVRITLPEFVG